jgi:phosphoribosylglycinamide formyltransferase-1
VDARLAVLASGTGTNLQALLDHPVVGPWVTLVVSDRGDARALERARERGVRAELLDPVAFADRAAYDAGLVDLLRANAIDVVVLAGFMRILGPEVVRAFPERIVNIHPALLPSFPGAHGIEDAFAWGVKVTGVTVHLVDEEMDHGPILAQEAVPILPTDDLGSLEQRIHQVEHRIYAPAVRAVVEGRVKLLGRVAHVLEEEGNDG